MKSNEAEGIVVGIIEKWSAHFTRLDADALASLYSKSAFFFGSNPTLYRGREGVAAYFNGLPRCGDGVLGRFGNGLGAMCFQQLPCIVVDFDFSHGVMLLSF